MNLFRAREILELNLKMAPKKTPPDVKVAMQLWLESINFVFHWRRTTLDIPFPLLPSETLD